jgi:alcohol-forming fatty acyl-CoA reductase
MERTEQESIRKFYENSEIFITGGSGFIGKVLIEKILRSCESVGKIYILLRKKKNKSLEERIKQITDDVVSNFN